MQPLLYMPSAMQPRAAYVVHPPGLALPYTCRYVLPPPLGEVLGMLGHETRSRVMVALYGFIKSRRLQVR